jgi:hypothetical protein
LHGFEASLHSSMSLQRFPSISNMYPDEQAQEKDPGLMTLNNKYQLVSITVKRYLNSKYLANSFFLFCVRSN